MTEKKNPQNDTVDWAERLKASMNQAPAERPASATPAPEEDDLAALLRAQLAHRAESAETSLYDLDTSEFEEEDEVEETDEVEAAEAAAENEEIFEIEEAEETEVIEIPAPTPETDDLPWDEDEEDETAPLPELSTTVVYTAEEVPAPIPEPDDLPWDEDEEDETAPLPEPAATVVYIAEETPASIPETDDLPWDDDEEDETDPLPEPPATVVYTAEEDPTPVEEPAPILPRRITIEPVPFEEDIDPDEEESLSPDGAVGDLRLLAADEESAKLLSEVGLYDGEDEDDTEPDTEESAAEETVPVAVPAAEKPAVSRTPAAPVLPDDPLQLGLDDVYARVDTLPPAEEFPEETEAPPRAVKSKPATPKKAPAYTERMAHDSREEAVRDAELYLHLGYEEQMIRTEQQDAVEEARRRALRRENTAPRNETAAVKTRREFTEKRQTPAIERAYTRTRRLGFTRLCVAAAGALFGILYDYLGVILSSVSGITFADSFLYPLIGMLWTVLVCLPFLPRLGRGLKSLIDFEPTRYAVSALALTVAVIHGAVAILMHRPYLYGGVALFMLTVAAASEYITTVAEHRAFSVVSSGKTAFVLTDETTPASAARAEEAPAERTLTAVRTGRVSDYFARTGRYNPYMGRLNYLLPVALLAAIICAGLAVMRGGSILYHGVPVFTATYLSCLPAAYLTAMSLPLLRANGILRRKGAAVIGTAAPVDYTKRGYARLLIRDGDALGGLYRKEITLRDDPNVAHWRSQANRLFRLLECPLWKESPLGDDSVDGLCVEVAETEPGYVRLYLIELKSGESTEVMMGSRDALARRAVRLPKASMEKVYKKTEDSQVIYLAFDRAFRIAYAVEYRLGSTFARAVEKLASMGDSAGLVTYDPLVTPDLMKLERFKDLPAVEVLRPEYVESVRESRSGGVIATGRSLDLLYPYAACRRARTVYRVAHIISWLTVPAAMGLSLLSVFFGNTVLLSSAAVTAWQLLLAAALTVLSLCTVTRKSLFLKPDRKKAPKDTDKTAPAPHTTKTDKDTSTT